jgi:hypothetical protein
MDMQQKMQQLLARMDAWGKEMNTNQEKVEADRKEDREALNEMNASAHCLGNYVSEFSPLIWLSGIPSHYIVSVVLNLFRCKFLF